MFQIKDFASISASQINHARAVTDKITDFAPGSVARTLMEAPAVEMEELYMQFFLGLREAIPVATFLSFGFDTLPAAVARGYVRVSNPDAPSTDLAIPAGTLFVATDGRVYLSSTYMTWTAGTNSIRIPIEASAAGLAYNIAAGLITASPFFDSTYTITNSAITTGRDVETSAEREARFADFVRSLSRGTVVACEYAVKQAVVLDIDGNAAEYVARIGTLENPGYVRYFIYSNAGLASDALITDAQKRLDGWRDEDTGVVTPGFRSAGVRVEALRMVERAVAMSISVDMLAGYSLSDAAMDAITAVYDSTIFGVQPGDVLHLGTLIEQLLSVPGVKTIVPDANENIVCGVNEALIPGALTIYAL